MRKFKLIWMLWPSFVVAGIANSLFFAVFDPHDLIAFGEPLHAGRIAIYSVGFFAFWTVAISSNALGSFLQRSTAEVNQYPFDPAERPSGCPKGEEERCG